MFYTAVVRLLVVVIPTECLLQNPWACHLDPAAPLLSEVRGYTLNPNPSIHSLYCSIVVLQSSSGFADFDMSIHSSRFAFSSLQTQHGYGNVDVSRFSSHGHSPSSLSARYCPSFFLSLVLTIGVRHRKTQTIPWASRSHQQELEELDRGRKK